MAKLEPSAWLLCHALNCFCGDNHSNVLVFGSEDILDVSDGSCMLGVELVLSLVTRLICVLSELTIAATDIFRIGLGNHCLGWNAIDHTHCRNLNNKQGGEFGGDRVTWAVAPAAEQKGSTT